MSYFNLLVCSADDKIIVDLFIILAIYLFKFTIQHFIEG